MFSEEDGDDRIVPTEDVLRIIGPMDDSDSEIIDEFLKPDEEEIDEEEGVDNEDNNEEVYKITSFPYYKTTRSMNPCYEMTAYEQFKKLPLDKQKTKLFEDFDDLQHFIIKSEPHWKAIDDLDDSDDEDSDEESDPNRKQLLSDWFEGLHKIWEDHYGENRITDEDLKEKRVLRKVPKLSKSPFEIPRLHEKITEDLEVNRHNFGIPETKGVSKPIATTEYPHQEVDERSSTISSQPYSGDSIEHLETKNVLRLENTKKFVSLPKVKKEDTELRFSDDEFDISTCSVNSAYHEEFNRFYSDLRNNEKVEPFPVLKEKRQERLKFVVPSSVRNFPVELSKSTADRRKIPERNAKRHFMQIQWDGSTYDKHQFDNPKSVSDKKKKKRNNIGKPAKRRGRPPKIQSSPPFQSSVIKNIAKYHFRPRKT